MYYTGNDGCQNVLVFAPMLSFLILDSNKKVTNWILTGISSQKIKPFDTNLEPTMPNLANGRIKLKFNNSVLVQKVFLHCIVTLFLNLYIVYELNTWPGNSTSNFPLKNYLFGTVKLVRNAIKGKFTYKGRAIDEML